MSLQELIQEVRTLPAEEQKQLLQVFLDIVTEPHQGREKKKRSLRELRGLGKEISVNHGF